MALKFGWSAEAGMVRIVSRYYRIAIYSYIATLSNYPLAGTAQTSTGAPGGGYLDMNVRRAKIFL
jgi:hypothetical protein